MASWYMLTLIGKDRAGIVAAVTRALFEGGCNLGEASMIRLGGSFTIMLMIQHDGEVDELERLMQPAAQSMALRFRLDPIEGHRHDQLTPDVQITVFGADRAGIVAQVTGVLAGAGLNVLDLRSDVAGGEQGPLYILHIEGQALQGVEALRAALSASDLTDLEVTIEPVDTFIG